jgi:hypothetical protein
MPMKSDAVMRAEVAAETREPMLFISHMESDECEFIRDGVLTRLHTPARIPVGAGRCGSECSGVDLSRMRPQHGSGNGNLEVECACGHWQTISLPIHAGDDFLMAEGVFIFEDGVPNARTESGEPRRVVFVGDADPAFREQHWKWLVDAPRAPSWACRLAVRITSVTTKRALEVQASDLSPCAITQLHDRRTRAKTPTPSAAALSLVSTNYDRRMRDLYTEPHFERFLPWAANPWISFVDFMVVRRKLPDAP